MHYSWAIESCRRAFILDKSRFFLSRHIDIMIYIVHFLSTIYYSTIVLLTPYSSSVIILLLWIILIIYQYNFFVTTSNDRSIISNVVIFRSRNDGILKLHLLFLHSNRLQSYNKHKLRIYK